MQKVKLITAAVGLLQCSFLFGQASVYDCQPEASVVTQNQIYVPDPFFYQRCIVFEANQSYIYDQYSRDAFADIHIRAGKSISIEPDFRAGEFAATNQGTGSFLMDISPEVQSPFEVVVMNYDHLEEVLRHDRLELGVKLPATIQTAVNNFLTEQAGNKINPYLSWELEVTAEFYPLSNPSNSKIIQGFHYVPFQREELPLPPPGTTVQPGFLDLLGSWTQEPTDYPFRIRFAPPQTGDWQGIVRIKTPSGVTSSAPFLFKVIPSNKKPPLNVGSNKRYLERDGESFLPLGNNLKWPRTTCPYDPDLADLMQGSGALNIEQYRAHTPPVRSYRKFREQIDALADGGANLFRMIMAPQGNDIEFEELGNYSDRQNIAYELDDILYKAEERDLLIQWNLQVHFPFVINNPYTAFWDWGDEGNTDWSSGIVESGHCYQTTSNGGLISDVVKPMDFFTSGMAKKYYKERLRYIIARWGYSNSIACFELFSEIDQVGTEYDVARENVTNCEYSASTENNPGEPCADVNNPKYQVNQTHIFNWQTEMINYMHNVLDHNKHLYMIDYAGKPGDYDPSYGIPEVDFITRNSYDWAIYDDEEQTVSFNFPRHIVQSMSNSSPQFNYFATNRKPAWFSEVGPIPVESKGFDKQIEMLRSQWKMLFSGAAGSLDWESDINQLNAYNNFGKMNTFFQGVRLDEDQWHPGNVLTTISPSPSAIPPWKYKQSWGDDMVQDDNRGDLMYLRRGDSRTAIGMITNTTYNYYNNGLSTGIGCFSNETSNFQWGNSQVANDNRIPYSISSNSATLKLRNMLAKNYQIEYYWAHDPNTVIHTSYGWGPMIQLEYDMLPNEEQYIMLFKAFPKRDRQFRLSKDPDETGSDNELIVYPNPSKGVFTIETNDLVGENVTISITDIYGKVVYFKENTSSDILNVDIAGEAAGLYFIRVVTEIDEWIKKVVIQ